MISRAKVLRTGPIVRITFYVEPFSWVHAYIDSEMGTLLICSDLGDWTHRWGLAGMPEGTTFLEFILRTMVEDSDYVTRKLVPRDQRREFDAGATKKHLRRRLARAGRWHRSRGTLYVDTYVLAVTEIGFIETIHDLEALTFVPGVIEIRTDEDVVYRESYDARRLRTKVLPAVVAAYRECCSAGETP